MKKTFTYEFEEEKSNTLTYEYSQAEDERLSTSVENGVPTIYANSSALIMMARIFIKMASGSYANGFHVHLGQDFNFDLPDCLTVILDEASSGGGKGTA